jgi:hypothetical protein
MFGAAVFIALMGIFAPVPLGISLVNELIVLICAVVFSKLTVKIDNETLRAYFGLGIRCKKAPLAEIVACEPIPVRWWYGWGIHLTPYGWLYNISGWDAVAIKLRDGRRFALGTNDPDALVTAIQSCIS